MTLREVTALVALYRACQDEAARVRALELVPDLTDLVADAPPPERAQVWRLTAIAGNGNNLGARTVVCRESDVREFSRAYAAEFDLAAGVAVEWRKL